MNMKEIIKSLKESDDAFVRSNTEKIEPILLKINDCIVSIIKKTKCILSKNDYAIVSSNIEKVERMQKKQEERDKEMEERRNFKPSRNKLYLSGYDLSEYKREL